MISAQTGSQILKTASTGSGYRKLQFEFMFKLIFGMFNHLVFKHYPITCHFRKIHTLGSTEPAGIVEGELFGSVTVKLRNPTMNRVKIQISVF